MTPTPACVWRAPPLWFLYILRPLHLSFLVSPHLPPSADDSAPYLVMSVWTDSDVQPAAPRLLRLHTEPQTGPGRVLLGSG